RVRVGGGGCAGRRFPLAGRPPRPEDCRPASGLGQTVALSPDNGSVYRRATRTGPRDETDSGGISRRPRLSASRRRDGRRWDDAEADAPARRLALAVSPNGAGAGRRSPPPIEEGA